MNSTINTPSAALQWDHIRSKLTQGLTHELNNSFTAIIGTCDLGNDSNTDPFASIKNISSQAQKTAQLLSILSGKDSQDPQWLNLNQCITDLRPLFTLLLPPCTYINLPSSNSEIPAHTFSHSLSKLLLTLTYIAGTIVNQSSFEIKTAFKDNISTMSLSFNTDLKNEYALEDVVTFYKKINAHCSFQSEDSLTSINFSFITSI